MLGLRWSKESKWYPYLKTTSLHRHIYLCNVKLSKELLQFFKNQVETDLSTIMVKTYARLYTSQVETIYKLKDTEK